MSLFNAIRDSVDIADIDELVNYARYVSHERYDSNVEAVIIHQGNEFQLFRYCRDVVKGRWPQFEYQILHAESNTFFYLSDEGPVSNFFLYPRDIIKGRWREAELVLLNVGNPVFLYYYSKWIIKGKWPEAEAIISSDKEIYKWYNDIRVLH